MGHTTLLSHMNNYQYKAKMPDNWHLAASLGALTVPYRCLAIFFQEILLFCATSACIALCTGSQPGPTGCLVPGCPAAQPSINTRMGDFSRTCETEGLSGVSFWKHWDSQSTPFQGVSCEWWAKKYRQIMISHLMAISKLQVNTI